MPTGRADLVVLGRIATLAGDRGFGWVEAAAVRGGTVVAAGTRAEIEGLVGPGTRAVRMEPDEVVVPAFADAHLHLGTAALASEQLDLRGEPTLDGALARIAERHAVLRDPGEWLLGFGWHAAPWGRSPNADDLETVAPGRPIFLWSHDHHAAWASHEAMRRAGIAGGAGEGGSAPRTSATRGPYPDDPSGGRLGRDEAGRPSGLFHEGAVAIVAAALPAVTTERLADAIERYAARLRAMGIVAVHDPGPLVSDPGLAMDVAACTALAGAGRLPVRTYASVREDSLDTAIGRGLRSGESLLPADAPPELRDRCRVGWLKLFADGALGSRTAALLQPYEREPHVDHPAGERGILTMDPEDLARIVARAAAAGVESEIHAIGDAAVRVALDAFAALPGEAGAGEDGPRPRRRVEHAQLVDPADLGRFASLGVVASVQPSHLATDAPGAIAAWGNRAEVGAYAYGSLERAGAVLAFGSDAPVETVDPWLTLAFAICRAPSPREPAALGAPQRLDPAAAYRASSIGPALAAGDARGGRLVSGSRAEMLLIPAAALEDPLAAKGSARLVDLA